MCAASDKRAVSSDSQLGYRGQQRQGPANHQHGDSCTLLVAVLAPTSRQSRPLHPAASCATWQYVYRGGLSTDPPSLSMAMRPMTEQERIDAKTLAIEVSACVHSDA